jgi:6-phosphofructokinase 1
VAAQKFNQEIHTMRVALLTGGGDCPGLNAVIYAAVRKGINHYGDEFIGFLNGWKGVLDNNFIPLTLEAVDGIQLKGGTILHSSRTNVKKIPGGIEKVQEVLKLNKIDALIALGGDDTQSVTLFLSENGVPSVGVPAGQIRLLVSTPPSPSPLKRLTASAPPPTPTTASSSLK